MATDSKVAEDSSTPPSYHKILATPIQCDQSSIFSIGLMKKKRAAVLSRIRDIVLAPDYIPSSVVPNVIACAAALPATEFSKILTQLNIEGHTAPYWAIVNNRPQGVCGPSLSLCSFIDLMVSLAGRIWWFSFYIPEPSYGSCRTAIGLSQHSYQARFNAVLLIEAHSRKPGRAAPPEALKIPLSLTDTNCLALVPWQYVEFVVTPWILVC